MSTPDAFDRCIEALVEYGHYHKRYVTEANRSWSRKAGPMSRKDRRLHKEAARALANAMHVDEQRAQGIWDQVEQQLRTHLIFSASELRQHD